MLANENAQIVPNQVHDNAVSSIGGLNLNIQLHSCKNISQELLCLLSRSQLLDPGQDPGRLIANKSQEALARCLQNLKLYHIRRHLQLCQGSLLSLLNSFSSLFDFNSHQSYLLSSTSTSNAFSLRNIYHCCTIWQRFMVTQYTTSPDGKFREIQPMNRGMI